MMILIEWSLYYNEKKNINKFITYIILLKIFTLKEVVYHF
jgi:hypothetical protein